MIEHVRFRLYRWLLGTSTSRDFARHVVWPLEAPSDDHIEVEPLCDELPRLLAARNYPATEHAEPRLRGHRRRMLGRRLVSAVPARHTAPVGDDLESLLAEIYPARYRSIWPTPPASPPELDADDVLAALAVSGPFAIYLRHASVLADPPDTIDFGPDDHVVDMRLFDGRPTKPGLLAPGGLAVFRARDGGLHTRGILYAGRFHEPGDATFGGAALALRCALNTHLTTLFHNVTLHLAYVTPMAVATTNELDTDHPIRRLLHPALQTTLIGNHQLASFQIVGPHAFATVLFSHDHETLMEIVNEYLDDFHPGLLQPDTWFERSGLAAADIPLPSWEDRLELWRIVRGYVDAYIAHSFVDDAAVADDAQLEAWIHALDELLPNGLGDAAGDADRDEPLDRDGLARLCATFLHVSSVTHDLVNNVVWDYSTLNHVFPTQIPDSGRGQDVRISFDFMNTLIGTWKPFNMVLDGCSQLALDETGRRLMDEYVAALRDRQDAIDNAPRHTCHIQPRDLNPSVSN